MTRAALYARGKSDREVARALNAQGFRTAGNQGNRLFSKDTVSGILTNRFYAGQITDGNGGWISAPRSLGPRRGVRCSPGRSEQEQTQPCEDNQGRRSALVPFLGWPDATNAEPLSGLCETWKSPGWCAIRD